MRFLVIALFTLMAAVLIAFALNNVGTTVSVTLLRTYPDVSLWVVVAAAYTLGAVGVGLAAVAEGANTRLANLRLRRELRKLEVEVNYLRTQPGRAETAAAPPERATAPAPLPAATQEPVPEAAVPSAPVYEAADTEGAPEADDEPYTGGRAV